jgi:hypothetical protein
MMELIMWDEQATPKQVRAISKLATRLGIREPLEERLTRLEARNRMWELRGQARSTVGNKNKTRLGQPTNSRPCY